VFLDKVNIRIASGRGGNGARTFRQEKFVACGGPDGGDGGRGGDVYLLASNDLNTLLDFKYKSFFKAEDGERGGRAHCSGKSGEDLIIKVPVGTVVRDNNAELTIADLRKDGDKVLIAQGGRGGRGNARFKSNTLRVPNFSEPGEAAIERELELELKMIADVGIIGFPNAGKSTFISKLSAAKPKIADYAFTTITPNLGVVKKQSGDSYVMADIPGLIEGASEGKGLGHQFLRHIERTKVLIHMIDVWGLIATNIDEYSTKAHEDSLNNFVQLNYELAYYSPKLKDRKQIIVLNKIEGYPQDELIKLVRRFEEYTGLKLASYEDIDSDSNFIALFTISAVTGEGLRELRQFIELALDKLESPFEEIELDDDTIATNHDDSHFTILKQDQSDSSVKWQVSCGKLERLMKITDITDLDSLQHLFYVTRAIGIIEEIKSRGAEEGDLLNIDGVDFEVTDAVLL
jgi:GTP-binding protein